LKHNPSRNNQSINYPNIDKQSDRKWIQKIKSAYVIARPIVAMFFFDIVLPFVLYYILKLRLSLLLSLILSSIPPLLRVFYVYWKGR
ncbi:uncharacterized protein B0P05DRAFT_614994, partial [Gilbertella persicaria]|uniref:uncharacterized protein n=1 Tax=Gilbertella persicaria TaxID=101096 RepID=UPI00221EB196